MFGLNQDKIVRKPAVAGAFYSADPIELSRNIDELLLNVAPSSIDGSILGLVSPHAGYSYSGQVAAHAYAAARSKKPAKVVVLSPCHVDAFYGAAAYDGDAYETPLGLIEVDTKSCKKLANFSPAIKLSAKGHRSTYGTRGEHALEVQLPFLQRTLSDFQLVPIVMGDQGWDTCKAVAGALVEVFPDPEQVLIVASSDLSHFYQYDEARSRDRRVINAFKRRDYCSLAQNLHSKRWEACGGGPIVTMMLAAELLGANTTEILCYANSGDVADGDQSRVVGYVSAAFYRASDPSEEFIEGTVLSPEERATLLQLAHRAVEASTVDQTFTSPVPKDMPQLELDSGVFVTIRKSGQLRGCVGSVVALEPLYKATATAAVNAARHDLRFPPVSEDELDKITVFISVLSPLRKLRRTSDIQIGEHGLMVESGGQRGLLLPQVAVEQSWDRFTFLEHTCFKAGLAGEAWKEENTDIFIFSAEMFGD